MKKKIGIAILVIIVLIIGIFTCFFISDMKQEENYKTELTGILELSNEENINFEEINKRLDRTVTRGDYAEVEKSSKAYLKDSLSNIIKITELLSDDRLTKILSAENYKEDGKEFIKTKEYIESTKSELEKCKTQYYEFFTEEKAMSYINDKQLDSYYIDLYKEEFTKDIESGKNDKAVENSINELIELLNDSETVINFLVENKNNWQIEEETIMFTTNNLADQYNELLSKLAEI